MIRGLTQRIHSTFDKGLSYDACLLDDIGDFFVHVELIASPINPADMNMIEGSYLIQPDCPYILGVMRWACCGYWIKSDVVVC